MNSLLKKVMVTALLAAFIFIAGLSPVFAVAETLETTPAAAALVDEGATEIAKSKAAYAAIAIGVVAAAGAFAMGMVISKSVESIARQPEAEGKIRSTLLVGLVFVETAIIYALVVAIMIIFVL
ncbi:MAG: ATP synthase F0 subunit C [Christensenellales bacterium]|jgi:F-type H+-transporting ATPase subunit c